MAMILFGMVKGPELGNDLEGRDEVWHERFTGEPSW